MLHNRKSEHTEKEREPEWSLVRKRHEDMKKSKKLSWKLWK